MTPSTRTVVASLTQARIAQLGRAFDVALPASATKDKQAQLLAESGRCRFRPLIERLGREELRAACRAHELAADGRSRVELAARLLQAHGQMDSVLPAPAFRAGAARYEPKKGDIVSARRRQWLVDDVAARDGETTLVSLVCLDDDAAGDRVDVLWELELGARILQPGIHELGEIKGLDDPRLFGAYYHALKWNTVTATDSRLFQAPFRAGIKILQHQLTPLKKALELPRANLFIADDVGLGKTIEAGLVLQELALRQRVDFALVVCPASVALQWRDELERRFGMRFEIMSRAYVARVREQRGFGVQPWRTHDRFIVTYPLLRRPEYREPLLARLGERAHKSLLVLDEAHTVAPSTASKYAVSSRVTKMAYELAPRFENRLFLSATPHNGHSNSFTSLLQLLDPQRFTAGQDVEPADLRPVMVRRLKKDLVRIEGIGDFPERDVQAVVVGSPEDVEVRLSAMLAEYTKLMAPQKGQGRLAFVNLQKRLLSSLEAFHRTLCVHAKRISEGTAKTALQLALSPSDQEETDEYGAVDDDALDALDAETDAASRLIATPEGRAKKLLEEMLDLASAHKDRPDAKLRALLAWIKENMCAGVAFGGSSAKGAARKWSERRVIVFTEYGDTKRHLVSLLGAAFEGTDRGDERIVTLHGGMGDEARAELQRRFTNARPSDDPVRVLVATDAAREGINLQAFCADLFHFDLPWNPARIEQRNGRIDRAMQPERVVRCRYFTYPDRAEDAVLDVLVKKIDVIKEELGSLGHVVLDRFEGVLAGGIGGATRQELDAAEAAAAAFKDVTRRELESQREAKLLAADIHDAGKILSSSRKQLGFDPSQLRQVIDAGLEIAGARPLAPLAEPPEPDAPACYAVPQLGADWRDTLDTLRAPRARGQDFHSWRRENPPLPVTFEEPTRLSTAFVQLHLEHPFVKRVLSRFRSQGFGAHDLSRVTVLPSKREDVPHVAAIARLSLFGAGATRLHDELFMVVAPCDGDGDLEPLSDKDEKPIIAEIERLFSEGATVGAERAKLLEELHVSAPRHLAALRAPLDLEADAHYAEAVNKLRARADEEAEKLRKILEGQKALIERRLGDVARQTELEFTDAERDQREQLEDDIAFWKKRLANIPKEIESEPAQLRALYDVVLKKLEVVGLVYVWPESRL